MRGRRGGLMVSALDFGSNNPLCYFRVNLIIRPIIGYFYLLNCQSDLRTKLGPEP